MSIESRPPEQKADAEPESELQELWDIYDGGAQDTGGANPPAGHAETGAMHAATSEPITTPVTEVTTAAETGANQRVAPVLFAAGTAPERATTNPDAKKRRRIIAGIAGVVAVAAVAIPVASTVFASHKVVQAAETLESSTTTPEASAEVPAEGGAELGITGPAMPSGNIMLSHAITDIPTLPIYWTHGTKEGNTASEPAKVQRILAPGHTPTADSEHSITETETAIGFLDEYAYLLGENSSSNDYKAVLDDFTDRAEVKHEVLDQNTKLRELYGKDMQVIFFDAADAPVAAAEGGFTTYDEHSEQLPSIVTPADGRLYMRVATKGYDQNSSRIIGRQDPKAYSITDSTKVSIKFVYKPVGGGDQPVRAAVEALALNTSGDTRFPIDMAMEGVSAP